MIFIYDFRMKKSMIFLFLLYHLSAQFSTNIPHGGTNDCSTSILRFSLDWFSQYLLMPQAHPWTNNNGQGNGIYRLLSQSKLSWWGLGREGQLLGWIPGQERRDDTNENLRGEWMQGPQITNIHYGPERCHYVKEGVHFIFQKVCFLKAS